MKRALFAIPARWSSSRFPGKPLHEINGKPLLWHVWQRCLEVERYLPVRVVIAGDDERVAKASKAFADNRAEFFMTSLECESGTDRIAELLRILQTNGEDDFDVVVNVQGDEPLISPRLLADLVVRLRKSVEDDIVSAASAISNEVEYRDPNVVKIALAGVKDKRFALYFSRAPIPDISRINASGKNALSKNFTEIENIDTYRVLAWRHFGVYAYRPKVLEKFASLPPSPLEMRESLEQLRALENGMRIGIVLTTEQSLGVDTPAQAREVEAIMRRNGFSSGKR